GVGIAEISMAAIGIGRIDQPIHGIIAEGLSFAACENIIFISASLEQTSAGVIACLNALIERIGVLRQKCLRIDIGGYTGSAAPSIGVAERGLVVTRVRNGENIPEVIIRVGCGQPNPCGIQPAAGESEIAAQS